jgi:hypothetical protein
MPVPTGHQVEKNAKSPSAMLRRISRPRVHRLTQITERLIKHFDHEPELKARIAQALVEIDDEQSA